MKNIMHKTGWLAAIISAATLAIGCKTVIRENVISTIDTGFGATIMENKQTQVPEIKVGYIRSQFYSVPTGKLVENSSTNNAMVTGTNGVTTNAQISNAANVTPNMVAGIRVHSSWSTGLFGADISENFALGDLAVNSPAATAMYIADSADPANAGPAAKAAAAQAKARQDYTKAAAAKIATGEKLEIRADALVDSKITNASQLAAVTKAGVETGVFEQNDADKLNKLATDGKLDQAKEQLKVFNIATSPSDVNNLSAYVDKLQQIQ